MDTKVTGMVTRSGRRLSVDRSELGDEDNNSTCSTPTKRRVRRLSTKPDLEDLPEAENMTPSSQGSNKKTSQPLESTTSDSVKKEFPLHAISNNTMDSPSRNLRKRNVSLTSPMENRPRESVTPKKAVRKIESSLMHNIVDSPKLRKNKKLSGGLDIADASHDLTGLRRSRRLSGELNIVLEDPIREEQQEYCKVNIGRRGKRLSMMPAHPTLPEECEDVKEIKQSPLCQPSQDLKEIIVTSESGSPQLESKCAKENKSIDDGVVKLSPVSILIDKLETKSPLQKCNLSNSLKKSKESVSSPRQSPRIRSFTQLDKVEDVGVIVSDTNKEITPCNDCSQVTIDADCSPMEVDVSFKFSADNSQETKTEVGEEKLISPQILSKEQPEKENEDATIELSVKSPLFTESPNMDATTNNRDEGVNEKVSPQKTFSHNMSESHVRECPDLPSNKSKRLSATSLDKTHQQIEANQVHINNDLNTSSCNDEDIINMSCDIIPASQEVNIGSSPVRPVITKSSSLNNSQYNTAVEQKILPNTPESSSETPRKPNIDDSNKCQDINLCINNHSHENVSINVLDETKVNPNETLLPDNKSELTESLSGSVVPDDDDINNSQTKETNSRNNSFIHKSLNSPNNEGKNKVVSDFTDDENVEIVNNSTDNLHAKDQSVINNTLSQSFDGNKELNLSLNVENSCESTYNANKKEVSGSITSTPCSNNKSLPINTSKKSVRDDVDDLSDAVNSDEKSGDGEDLITLQLMDESASEAGSDYKSGDSLCDSDKEEIDLNEIIEKGESLHSGSDEEESDVSEYEKDSFVCTSDDEQSDSTDTLQSNNKSKEFSQSSGNRQFSAESLVENVVVSQSDVKEIGENTANNKKKVEGMWIVSPLKPVPQDVTTRDNIPSNPRKRKLVNGNEIDAAWTNTAGEFNITEKTVTEAPTCPTSASHFGTTTTFNIITLKKTRKNILTVDPKLTSSVNFKENMLYGNNIKRKDSKNVKNIQQKIKSSKLHRNK